MIIAAMMEDIAASDDDDDACAPFSRKSQNCQGCSGASRGSHSVQCFEVRVCCMCCRVECLEVSHCPGESTIWTTKHHPKEISNRSLTHEKDKNEQRTKRKDTNKKMYYL